jgi:uncharacterized protein YbbC (DUF1343 family)
MKLFVALFFLSFQTILPATVKVGADVFFEEGLYKGCLQGKRVGLITNQSAVNSKCQTTLELFTDHKEEINLVALFAPEHGFYGDAYACENIQDKKIASIPLYSLHGTTRRPTVSMLETIDVLVFDIQDIGARSYTFISTLFYCIEEAAKHHITMIVLDRPNPMGGHVVDGPLLHEGLRSFVGYVNVPYCHGMTVAELAHFFNKEYNVGCSLTVVPMQGYKRGTPFQETGLIWVPTSPQIPEADTPFFYSTTGVIGHMSIVSMGVGYTLPFKLIGAPWISAEALASHLNEQKLPGVFFQPYHFRPFFGKFKLENCQGVRIVISDSNQFLPMTTQYTILGVLKRLYPKQFEQAIVALESSKYKKDLFDKLNGDKELFSLLKEERYIIWKLRALCEQAREYFLPIRKKYLLPDYNS